MPYCENCGHRHDAAKNFCRKCGQPLGNTTTSVSATAGVSQAVQAGILGAHSQIAYRKSQTAYKRRARTQSSESLDLYLRCIGVIAFIHGLSFFIAGLEKMLDGFLGWVLICTILIMVVCKAVFDLRSGETLTKSLLKTALIGVVVYGVTVGGMYYLSTYIHSLAGTEWLVLPAHGATPAVTPVK